MRRIHAAFLVAVAFVVLQKLDQRETRYYFRPGAILERGDGAVTRDVRWSWTAQPTGVQWAAGRAGAAQSAVEREKTTVAACAVAGAALAVLIHGVRAGRAPTSPRGVAADAFLQSRGRIALLATSGSPSAVSDPRERIEEVLSAGRAAADDALQVLQETGPEAVLERTLQAQRALFETAQELAQELPTPPNPPLPRIGASFEELFVDPLMQYFESLPKELAPRTLRKLFERLGSTYIKLGQFIASSPTLFPEEYVQEFQACLDQSPTVPFDTIRSIVEDDLGRPASEVFSDINTTPLASASIAQVHAATLVTGEDVVIKVRKPGVENVLKADLGFLAASTRIIEVIVPDLDRFSFAGIVADLRTSMLEELNFENEARNIAVFSDFLDKSNLRGVAACPVVYPSASGKRVLTMERFNGVPITDVEGIKRYGRDPEKMLVSALNVWTASVVEAESFHADVHAGNILALVDGRVGFIDFGIVGRIPPPIWEAVKNLAGATMESDFRGMAKALVQMGATKGRVDEDAFAKDIAEVVVELQKVDPELTLSIDDLGSVVGTVQLDDQAVTNVLLRIVRVADTNGVKLPREFGVLLKQYLYFDRYTKVLAPGLDVLRDERVDIGRVIDVEAQAGPSVPRLEFGTRD